MPVPAEVITAANTQFAGRLETSEPLIDELSEGYSWRYWVKGREYYRDYVPNTFNLMCDENFIIERVIPSNEMPATWEV